MPKPKKRSKKSKAKSTKRAKPKTAKKRSTKRSKPKTAKKRSTKRSKPKSGKKRSKMSCSMKCSCTRTKQCPKCKERENPKTSKTKIRKDGSLVGQYSQARLVKEHDDAEVRLYEARSEDERVDELARIVSIEEEFEENEIRAQNRAQKVRNNPATTKAGRVLRIENCPPQLASKLLLDRQRALRAGETPPTRYGKCDYRAAEWALQLARKHGYKAPEGMEPASEGARKHWWDMISKLIDSWW